MGSVKELGKYKKKIASPIYNSETIKVMLLGNDYASSTEDIDTLLKKHVFSHLFVDGVVTETQPYIFYDITIPNFGTTIKDVKLIVYAICHRDILDVFDVEPALSPTIIKDYYGNRCDKLSQALEEIFCEDNTISKNFGIGSLTLTDVSLYNVKNFYGRILTFTVPDFR